MRNSAELRRFSSPHPSLFFWIFRLKWQGNDGQGLYREGGPCCPWGGRQAPVARWGGDRPPFIFFLARDLVTNLKKKITFRAYRPPIGRPGYIFEIFRNGHIFLKFWFCLNIKKKKAPQTVTTLNSQSYKPIRNSAHSSKKMINSAQKKLQSYYFGNN